MSHATLDTPLVTSLATSLDTGLDSSAHRVRWHETPAAGYAVLSVVVLIWAAFALTMRAIGASALTTADVALIRFAVPVICLAPLLPRAVTAFRRIRLRDAAMVLLGGVPFFFVASAGAAATSAAHVGALVAGTSPLSVALIGLLVERRAITRAQARGLALIALGVLGLVLGQGLTLSGASLGGMGLLLAASLIWGVYTTGLRRTGLDPVSNGLLVAVGSLLVQIPLMLSGLVDSHLSTITFHSALPFLLIQGLGVGVISTIGYAFAISRLGAARSATVGSLAPALAALLAVPLLGESLGLATFVAILVMSAGVVLANRS
ncbi:DMT family transporter [Roseibium aestuarii]|uniref:DMT family transporter n=1 Tax=Roseibium aestuarii TaxID=2600299 RepID=A0ABW4JUF5_9HYPH|nr:DMT family transporter [Roseibium aestuarii]